MVYDVRLHCAVIVSRGFMNKSLHGKKYIANIFSSKIAGLRLIKKNCSNIWEDWEYYFLFNLIVVIWALVPEPSYTGPHQQGPRQLGSSQLGPSQLWPDQLGPRQLSSVILGPEQLGHDLLGPCKFHPDQQGPGHWAAINWALVNLVKKRP